MERTQKTNFVNSYLEFSSQFVNEEFLIASSCDYFHSQNLLAKLCWKNRDTLYMHIATRAKRCETSRAIRRVATICTYVHMVATLIYLDLPFILVLHLDAYFSFLLITHATSPAWCRSGNHTFSRLQLPLRIQLLLSSPFLRFFE